MGTGYLKRPRHPSQPPTKAMHLMTAGSIELEKPAAPPPFQFGLKQLLLTMAGLSVALAITVPLWRIAQQEARKIQSSNNLKQIAIGLHNYHDIHGSFPSAYIPDSSGRRMHSWRVLIAPFVEKSSFHASYDYGKPWNDPTNLALTKGHRLFRSPFDSQGPPTNTNYVAIVGPGTMWPGEHGMPISGITDGTSNTIMIVEITNSDIHWMEPRDLPIEELEA